MSPFAIWKKHHPVIPCISYLVLICRDKPFKRVPDHCEGGGRGGEGDDVPLGGSQERFLKGLLIVKSSEGIFTHQGHISKVGSKSQSVTHMASIYRVS